MPLAGGGFTQEIEGAEPAGGLLSFCGSAEPEAALLPLCDNGIAGEEAAARLALSVERE